MAGSGWGHFTWGTPPWGTNGFEEYRTAAMAISKKPTTLIRITIDAVTGTSQVAGGYLFSMKERALHINNPTTALPYLDNDIFLGQEIKDNVTLSGRVLMTFHDDHDSDGATYWRKWIAANPYYRNRIVEVLKGFDGFTESAYIVLFKGVLQNIKFRTDGMVEVIAKSLLQVTNKELPKPTDGQLSGVLNSGAITELTLKQNTGIDLFDANGHQYDTIGYIKIDTEIFQYTSVVDISSGAKTQFKFTGVTRAKFLTDNWDDGITDNNISHADGAIVQQVEVFLDMHPLDVMTSLLTKASIASGDINTTSFTNVKNDWLQGALVRGILHEPAKIKTYLKELREVTFTSLWQNQNQQITVDFLAPGLLDSTFKQIRDESELIFKSFTLDDNEDSRVTRISFKYDERPDGSFKNKTTYVDITKESQYQEQKPITFESRWLRTDISGASLASQTAQNIIRVFGDGRTQIEFSLETKDDDLEVGDLFQLTTINIQDASGVPVNQIKYQVIKKEQAGINKWKYKAFDTRLTKRFGFYASDTLPDYIIATESERQYAFWADDNDVMPNGDGGYFYF